MMFVVDAPQKIQFVLGGAVEDVVAHVFERKPFLFFLMGWDWDEGWLCQ
jgi:hypothetical protein